MVVIAIVGAVVVMFVLIRMAVVTVVMLMLRGVVVVAVVVLVLTGVAVVAVVMRMLIGMSIFTVVVLVFILMLVRFMVSSVGRGAKGERKYCREDSQGKSGHVTLSGITTQGKFWHAPVKRN